MQALLKEIILQPNYTVIMEMRGSCLEVQMQHVDEPLCVSVCLCVGHAVSDSLYAYKKTLSASFSPASFLVDYLLSAPLTCLLLPLYFPFSHFLPLKLP